MKKRLSRGYLGPIGDDLPSIFPIVFGVVLFMGAMIYAFNELGARDDYLQVRKATFSLSNVVMARGYLPDDYFNTACDSDYKVFATRQNIHALITVKKFCPISLGGVGPLDLSSNVFDVSGTGAPYAKRGLWCASDPDHQTPNSYGTDVNAPGFPKDFVILNYPVAVDCAQEVGSVKGVGMVNIIGWRR